MHKMPVPYELIDEGIREVVRTWNALPFVYTQSSCEGHLTQYSKIGPRIRADDGTSFLFGGHIIFRTDDRYQKAKEFLADLMVLPAKHRFVRLGKHHCGEESCSIEGNHVLDTDDSDLTANNREMRDDPLEEFIRKMHQVPTELGRQRVEQYREVWAECLRIGQKYR